MSVENLRSVMHIDPKEDVLYSIPDSDNHGDLLAALRKAWEMAQK